MVQERVELAGRYKSAPTAEQRVRCHFAPEPLRGVVRQSLAAFSAPQLTDCEGKVGAGERGGAARHGMAGHGNGNGAVSSGRAGGERPTVRGRVSSPIFKELVVAMRSATR